MLIASVGNFGLDLLCEDNPNDRISDHGTRKCPTISLRQNQLSIREKVTRNKITFGKKLSYNINKNKLEFARNTLNSREGLEDAVENLWLRYW